MRYRGIARAFVAGLWIGNGFPHLVNGLVGNDYPCKFGNGSTPNVAAGAVALAVSPAIFGPADRDRPSLLWAVAAAGAVVTTLVHARYVRLAR